SVKGQIDDRAEYSCEVTAKADQSGEKIIEDAKKVTVARNYSVEPRINYDQNSFIGNWKDAARDIIYMICSDGYVEFRGQKGEF
ncbi:MAG: hypothetical protein HQK54_03010, partial [Oligoflexales bacterium]|nr:hypothetical protein [Oligoflexales bacterium]